VNSDYINIQVTALWTTKMQIKAPRRRSEFRQQNRPTRDLDLRITKPICSQIAAP
jgi:hypothetical protein